MISISRGIVSPNYAPNTGVKLRSTEVYRASSASTLCWTAPDALRNAVALLCRLCKKHVCHPHDTGAFDLHIQSYSLGAWLVPEGEACYLRAPLGCARHRGV